MSPSQDRQIRVFISSTFLDMQEERNYLVKFIFPQLRKLCEDRGVIWGEVDLRWGITDEQKAEGKVLPICLEEIAHCRPYFIGLLGERYGWVPDAIPQEIIDRESWLKEHLQHSVTELEILHGVLRKPEMAEHAFFYFRDPSYIDTLPSEKRKDFLSESPELAGKLKHLKERIRQSKFPPRENYSDPKSLGDLILKDLTDLINKLYPEGSQPTPLDKEAVDQDVFAQSRARVYIGRKEYFDRLDSHAAGNTLPLVILGESGSGKSALLANWALRYRKDHPDQLLIMHFIGATPASTDWAVMLRRIMGEFQRHFIVGEIPDKPEELRQAFAEWLYRVSAQGKVVIILDALNQLEDQDAAPDLVWLPPTIPENIRFIVSTLPGRPLDELSKRNWPILTIQPLQTAERIEFIPRYLKQYRKTLNDARTQRISSANQTANPLYLRALLEELRQFGEYDKLDQKIDYYLKAQNPYELYQKIIVRWEEDYEGDTDLIGDSMSLIWASRRGLSESELLDLLGSDENPLPRATWSPFFLAARDSLVNRSGLLNFFHDYLRQAICDTYIPEQEHQKTFHLRLADYFEKKELGPRKVDELPWQLSQAQNSERLKDCLVNLDMFLSLYTGQKKYELLFYWLQIGKKYDITKEYQNSLDVYEHNYGIGADFSYRLHQIALFFYEEVALYESSEPLMRRALEIDEASLGNSHPDVARDLNNLAQLLKVINHLKEAEPLMRRALEINEKSLGRDHPRVAIDKDNLAQLLQDTNRLKEAEPLYRQALEISEKSLGPDHPNVANNLNNLAGLLSATNRPKEAEPLYHRALEIDKKSLGIDHPRVAIHLNNLAELLQDTNRPKEAEPLYRQALEISEKSLGPDHPNVATHLNNLAELLRATNRPKEAEPLMHRALEIDEKSLGRDHPNVAIRLHNLAQLLQATNRLNEAEPLMRRALEINEKFLGIDHPRVSIDLNNLAELLYATNRLNEAEPFMRRVLEIDEKSLGRDHSRVAIDLNNMAQLLQATNRLNEAEPLMRRALEILLKSLGGSHPWTQAIKNNYETLYPRQD